MGEKEITSSCTTAVGTFSACVFGDDPKPFSGRSCPVLGLFSTRLLMGLRKVENLVSCRSAGSQTYLSEAHLEGTVFALDLEPSEGCSS